jgi:hypothetical protein
MNAIDGSLKSRRRLARSASRDPKATSLDGSINQMMSRWQRVASFAAHARSASKSRLFRPRAPARTSDRA